MLGAQEIEKSMGFPVEVLQKQFTRWAGATVHEHRILALKLEIVFASV